MKPFTSKYNLNLTNYILNDENQIIASMIPNGGWHYLAVKKIICIIKRNSKMVIFVWIIFICLEQKTNLNHMKYEKIKIYVML